MSARAANVELRELWIKQDQLSNCLCPFQAFRELPGHPDGLANFDWGTDPGAPGVDGGL